MDSELYDEFGNYIGPELESDESDEGEEQGRDDIQVFLTFIYVKSDLSIDSIFSVRVWRIYYL